MSAFLTPTNCCPSSTCPPLTEAGPRGDQGLPGDPGTNGTNGSNAFTTTVGTFIVPAIGDTVTITVGSSLWMAIEQPLFVETAGFYQVVSLPSSTSVEIENLGYVPNAVPTTVISSGSSVVASGTIGLTGPVSDVDLEMPSAVFDVAKSTVGGVVTHTVTFDDQNENTVFAGPSTAPAGSPTFRALEAADIPDLDVAKITTGTLAIARGGTGAGTATAAFDNLAPTTTAGDTVYHNGTDNVRLPIGVAGQVYQVNTAGNAPEWGVVSSGLLGFASVDGNTTGDSAIPITLGGASKYIIRKIVAYDCSVFLNTLVGGIYTAASKGGQQVVPASEAWDGWGGATNDYVDVGLSSNVSAYYFTATTLYFSPTTPEGTPSTMTVAVYGDRLP